MTIFSRNIPAQSSEVCQKCLSWSEHAIERKTERKINLDVSNFAYEKFFKFYIFEYFSQELKTYHFER